LFFLRFPLISKLRQALSYFLRDVHVSSGVSRPSVFAKRVRPFLSTRLVFRLISVLSFSDLESLGYILLSFLAPLPWAPLARAMDLQYIQAGGRVNGIVTDLLRRIEAAKDSYLRGITARRGGDVRRGDEAVSLPAFPSSHGEADP
jgi:hypothetical protein